MKAATALIAVVVHNIIFQSTPPVKAATYGCIIKARKGKISIHAAREGGDSGRGIVEWDEVISIHAAREGGDTTFSTSSSVRPSFQSTPPVKAATLFSIFAFTGSKISIHAAREGGDDVDYIDKLTHTLFQSTPPVKAATDEDIDRYEPATISIHAAREGGDPTD